MNPTYEWLYDHYAAGLQQELRKAEAAEVEEWAEKLSLPSEDRLYLIDRLAALRLLCGTESFALGCQLGLQLSQDFDFAPTAF